MSRRHSRCHPDRSISSGFLLRPTGTHYRISLLLARAEERGIVDGPLGHIGCLHRGSGTAGRIVHLIRPTFHLRSDHNDTVANVDDAGCDDHIDP